MAQMRSVHLCCMQGSSHPTEVHCPQVLHATGSGHADGEHRSLRIGACLLPGFDIMQLQ
jgi:hypothetical protein